METLRFEHIKHYERYLPGMMREEQAATYIHQVYDYLELMKPDTILNIQADEVKLPWLLVAVGAFLAAQDHWMEFELNDDYTRLRRVRVPPNFLKAMRRLSAIG
ncbi:MAG: hypothetical protein HUK10_01305 [Bacteroides heparinolyticus]|nr:hypothetical protein [Bacteroides heparinolyticus]